MTAAKTTFTRVFLLLTAIISSVPVRMAGVPHSVARTSPLFRTEAMQRKRNVIVPADVISKKGAVPKLKSLEKIHLFGTESGHLVLKL